MKLIIKPERGFGKVEVELDEELVCKIKELSERYGAPIERIIEIALREDFKQSSGELEALERKVKELEEKTWKLEKEYSSLRFKAYGLSEDNKILAIELSGLIAENNQLRRFLGLKPERNIELRKLISYYLQG
jgi:DNA repair ATPase RecN